MTPYRYPDTSVFYRDLRRDLPLAVRGEGVWITDHEGRRYLDACGGAFVATVGHGVPEIAEAIARQTGTLAYVNGTQFTAEPVERLAAELARRAPGDLELAYFLSSGSDAVEAALKLARQYQVEIGQPGRHKVLSLNPGYHGNTLLALAASGRPRSQTWFGPWLTAVPRVPAPYRYRCQCQQPGTGPGPSTASAGAGIGPADCPVCRGDVLEQIILEEGPDTVAAFIAEPVGGSSTGAAVPAPDYWQRIRAICDRYGVLWIADEVLVGAGRTGTWSPLGRGGAGAGPEAEVVPDLMVLGKGISGGYAPLAAILAPRRVVDPIARGSGALLHAQTFSHHPASCAAGMATLEYLDRHRLVARCAERGGYLRTALERVAELPLVGDIRGAGLLAGVELVADRDRRAPFPRERKVAERVVARAMEEGLILWPNTGHADGTRGDLVMLAPPYVISESELDELVDRLHRTLAAVATDLG